MLNLFARIRKQKVALVGINGESSD